VNEHDVRSAPRVCVLQRGEHPLLDLNESDRFHREGTVSVVTDIQQAKSTSTNPAIFTNRGNASGKQAKKITRVPFTVSRLMEFCNKRELENQTAHDHREWPLVILKELVDNALDACEEAEIPPVVSIAVDGDTIVVEDNGPGIPARTIDGVLDYSVRVSSGEAYVSPTRGAQGNALKTILPMEYVLGRGEDACGKTLVEARGIAHRIEFSVDHTGRNRRSFAQRSRHRWLSGPRSRSNCQRLITVITSQTSLRAARKGSWGWPSPMHGLTRT
jgi:hypothetical protein